MAECQNCGNEYNKPLNIAYQGQDYTFDCFECAIATIAPHCAHCNTRIIGHGVEAGGDIYCCDHCARN